jgi:Fur family ferric uptake transcriptional regulator
MESALAILREGNGRVSTSRRAILETLVEAGRPMSPQQIATADGQSLDLASTYRSLEYLEGVGLVRHVHLGHSPGLYELAEPVDREYAVCDACGATVSFDPKLLDAARQQIQDALGYRARFSHFPIVGLCAECLAARADDAATEDEALEHSHDGNSHAHEHDHPHTH